MSRVLRRRGRGWLLMAVTGLALVSPLESGLLPGRLGEVLEPSPAEAQTPPPSFADGTPDPCPAVTGWRPADGWSPVPSDDDPARSDDPWDTASECVLRVPACPVSEVNRTFLMTLSVPAQHTQDELGALAFAFPLANYGGTGRYPEFCEDVVQKSSDETLYNRCRALRGYVVIAPITHGGEEYCRALTPIACPTLEVTRSGTTFRIATNRTGSQICGAVLRRGWTCNPGYERANTFNRCYQHPPWSPGSHPACGQGAPEFPLGGRTACEEYVDKDFLRNPVDRPCQGFIVAFDPGGNAYWCRYDPWLLRAECHRLVGRPADCSGPQASCIKRVSRTGGCDQIGQTILCRSFQGGFAQDPAVTLEVFQKRADALRTVETLLGVPHAVCNPCQHLPFSADPPDPRCASSATSRPRSVYLLEQVLAVKRDYPRSRGVCAAVTTTAEYESNTACQSEPVCADPPSGRITWTSEHPSGLAIVNNAVTVSVVDIPFARRTKSTIRISRAGVRQVTFRNIPYFTDEDLSSPTALTSANTIRLGDDSTTFGPEDYFLHPGTECRVSNVRPYFDLIVEELWPDHAGSRDEIIALFGAGSLADWNGEPSDGELSDPDKRALTEARGLEWLGDSPTDSQVTARRAALTVQHECVGNNFTECDWTPTRSGYFKLTAAGAWVMTQGNVRTWVNSFTLGSEINEALESDAIEQETKRRLGQLGLTAEDVGLETDASDRIVGVRDLNPGCGEDGDWLGTRADCPSQLGYQLALFDEEHAATASCYSIDLRVFCTSHINFNYTETEAVGVMVHEVRVNTVMPSR